MRLTLSRSGGFAGIRRPPITVDTGDLAPDEAALLEKLISDARLLDLASHAPATRQPDRFEYTIEAVPDNGLPHTVTIGEADAPPPLIELVRTIEQIAKRKR
ncbi:MAG: protealysin inhibitor emfourin [Verrucomicrobiia bacterium]